MTGWPLDLAHGCRHIISTPDDSICHVRWLKKRCETRPDISPLEHKYHKLPAKSKGDTGQSHHEGLTVTTDLPCWMLEAAEEAGQTSTCLTRTRRVDVVWAFPGIVNNQASFRNIRVLLLLSLLLLLAIIIHCTICPCPHHRDRLLHCLLLNRIHTA